MVLRKVQPTSKIHRIDQSKYERKRVLGKSGEGLGTFYSFACLSTYLGSRSDVPLK